MTTAKELDQLTTRRMREWEEMRLALGALVARYDELATGRTKAHLQFQREIGPARRALLKLDEP